MTPATLFHVPLEIAVRANSLPNRLALPLLENSRSVVLLVPPKAHHVATNGQNLDLIKHCDRVTYRPGASPKLESATHRGHVAREPIFGPIGLMVGDGATAFAKEADVEKHNKHQ
jgi:hypothetical protein